MDKVPSSRTQRHSTAHPMTRTCNHSLASCALNHRATAPRALLLLWMSESNLSWQSARNSEIHATTSGEINQSIQEIVPASAVYTPFFMAVYIPARLGTSYLCATEMSSTHAEFTIHGEITSSSPIKLSEAISVRTCEICEKVPAREILQFTALKCSHLSPTLYWGPTL